MKTEDDGRFTVIAPADTFLLVTAGEAGYADASSEEFEKSHRLVLQAWGSIEGEILIGKRPGAGQQVRFEPSRDDRTNVLYLSNHDQIKADNQGRFRFASVIPGAGRVSRMVDTDRGDGLMMSSIGWATIVEVESGKTARVTVGGKGRPVVCQVALEGTTENPINWRSNHPAAIAPIRGEQNDGPFVWTQYVGNIGADGKVQIDDVPPGRYELTIPVNAPDGPSGGIGSLIGEGRHKITVPDTPGDTPVDLGQITVTLFPTLKVGDEAPEFTVQQLAGPERIRLKDLAGKLVLLDFWATWSRPSLEEIPNLKEIHEAFGNDPRFALVGLNCDQAPDVGAKYVAKNELTWIQGFGGYIGERLTQNYKVSAFPAMFLVGPDGRILARNPRGPALKEAVQAALKDSALFARADKA
ncbi:TlpA family protein disulfide reductase, partial [Singulisphaera rosea]